VQTVDTFTVGHIFGLQPFFTQHHDYGGRSTNILAGDDCQVRARKAHTRHGLRAFTALLVRRAESERDV
jgi:hypothetical protein